MAEEEKTAVLEQEENEVDNSVLTGGIADHFYSQGEEEVVEEETPPEKAQEPEPEKKPEPEEPKKTLWDYDRQQRDQDHANERKTWQDKIGELEKRLDEAVKQSETTDKKPETADALSALQTTLNGLDEEDADATDIVSALKKVVPAIQGLSGNNGQNAVVSELTREIGELRETMAAEKARRVESENQNALEGLLKALNKEFGDKYQNEAIITARRTLEEEGYGADNLPDSLTTRLLLRDAYSALSGKDAKGSDKKANIPTMDTGTGGTSVLKAPKSGTLKEVMRDLKKAGVT